MLPPVPHIAMAHHRVSTPIQHIVVIVQENRTVDNLFNGYPGADTVAIDPYTGTVLKPIAMNSSCSPEVSHSDFVIDYDGGKMDGFSKSFGAGCTSYAFVPPSETKRYRALAATNVLADETFESEQSNSFPSHQYLYAGRSCSYPTDVYCMAENSNGYADCGAKKVRVAEIDMTQPYPGTESHYGPPCKAYTSTILGEATAAGLSWRYYTYYIGSLWAGPTADETCWNDPSCIRNVVVHPHRVLHEIATHHLANLVYVTPETNESDHPAAVQHSRAGENWVASVVNAIGNDPYYWPTTTILVTWDDWGGWYDHVAPPQAPFYEDPFEYAFRVPLIVASAYVTPGTVDHTSRNVYGSMLRYVETTFGLPSLQQVDAPGLTDDLSSLFNYGQTPKQFVPM